MNREETKNIIMVMSAAYPNYKPADKTVTVNTWYMAMEPYDYHAIEAALMAFIKNDTSGFAPSIGQVLEYYRQERMEAMGYPTPEEAYAMYRKAISHAQESQAEFNKLPPIVQQAVGSADNIYYTGMRSGYSEDAIRAHFLKAYENVLTREKRSLGEVRHDEVIGSKKSGVAGYLR